jgi:DNA-binding response OmpR family regulator
MARYDLVLLDWELPGLMVGSPSVLREGRPALTVIALSGRPEARRAALAAGVDAFDSKANPPERLLEAINAAQSRPGISLGSLSSLPYPETLREQHSCRINDEFPAKEQQKHSTD